MVKFLLKKSYQHNDLKEVEFKDLWNDEGVFTTMWIYGKPAKILFLKSHLNNLIKSLKIYKILKKDTKSKILRLLKINIDSKKKYNHLLRIALNKNLISISLRKKIKLSNKFSLKLINYQRVKPEHKNLKYKFILKNLSKLDVSKKDIALCVNGKILETGTSNILFVSENRIYSPINKYYRGNNLKFFEKNFKIYKKNIFVKDLKIFDEIILVGSGKSVISVTKIDNNKWKRKSIKIFKKLSNKFKKKSKKNIYLYK